MRTVTPGGEIGRCPETVMMHFDVRFGHQKGGMTELFLSSQSIQLFII